MTQDERPQPISDRTFIRRTLVVLALTSLFFIIWQMRSLLLLIFGAILVAVVFRAIADPIRRYTGAPEGLAVTIAVLFVIGMLAAGGWLFGSELSGQVRTLVESLPDAWRSLERRIGDMALGDRIEGWMQEAAPSGAGVLARIGNVAMTLGGGIADTLLVIAGGIYLAAQPGLYKRGALKLVPSHRRALAEKALDESGTALHSWLKGQLISMVVVGLLIGIGLWLIGVPSALALGLLAGLLDFVPIVGPIVAAVPALLLGLAAGPETALWTLGLYVLVQQIEGNILQPVVQQHAVDLPAVILLFSLLGFGMLFGALGIILAAPLSVVCYVLIKRLYVTEALDTPVSLPKE